MDDLVTDYDVIVVGTGMTESILAAALSRIGKSVLHIDSREYYGENWASFNFDGIQNWIAKIRDFKNDGSECEIDNIQGLNENESIFRTRQMTKIENVTELWYNEKGCDDVKEQVPLNDLDDTQSNLTKDENTALDKNTEFFRRESRRFNLDLCPKVLFSRGPLVELLISSNIAKYAEFKSVTRVLTWRNDCLELVPCSRADVFSTKNITVVEKRLLVQILKLFLEYPENIEKFSGYENKTFIEYLKHKKLPNNIIHYVLYAMAMGDNNTPCLEGVKASKAYVESLGRYGNTPFIFPMYGSGELPQCFCRLCAVFGGVYCLKREVEAMVIKDNRCTAIVSAGKRLNAQTFIFSSNYVPSEFVVECDVNRISRGIFVTERSMLASEKEPLTLLRFPPVPQISDTSVTVLELGPGTNTCPEKVCLVHMTANATADAGADLRHVVDALFRTETAPEEKVAVEKPKVLWSLTWNLTSESGITCRLENVRICSGPNSELDFNFSVNEARRLFGEICPGEEFLPRAPDPDEIVLESDEPSEAKETAGEGGSGGGGDVASANGEEVKETRERSGSEVEHPRANDSPAIV